MAADGSVFTPLGERVEFTNQVAAAALNDTFNAQRVAILELNARIEADRATAADRAAMIDRMSGDLSEALRADRRGRTEAFVAQGDAADVDHRFLLPDGSIRFRSQPISIPTPEGDIMVVAPGLLDTRTPASPAHAALRNAFHRYKMASFLRANGVDGTGEIAKRVWAQEVRPAMERMPGRVGEFLRSMLNDPATFKRVINATSGTGGDLISNPTMGVRRPTSMPRLVAGLVRRQAVTNKTFVPATIAGRGLPRARAVITNDPARFTPQAFTTGTASVSLPDFVINALVDSNWFRDVAPVADGLQLVLDWLDQAEADGIEVMLLHGDTAATHQDTLSTMTLGSYFASGQLDGSDSPLKKWLGLRARAADDSTMTSAGASFTASDLVTPAASLNTWDSGSVLLAGLKSIYTVATTSEFVTVDKFGAQAFVQAGAPSAAGAVGSIAGKRVYISEFLPNVVDTTNGLITGSNAGGCLILWNPRSTVIYEMDSPEADYDVSQPERGARYIGRNMTALLNFEVVSGEKPVASLYNIG